MELFVAGYRLLQRALLPPSFRRTYGEEMVSAFRARLRDERERGGRIAAGALVLTEAVDLLATAAREWRAAWRSRRRLRSDGPTARSSSFQAIRPGRGRWFGSLPAEAGRVLRSWSKRPGFVVATVLTLALAIGANTAVYSVVHAILLEPLPFPEPEELVYPRHTARGQGLEDLSNTDALYFLYSEHARLFEDFGLYLSRRVNLTGGDRPERVPALFVTHEALETLDVVPALGRLVTEADNRPGAPPVAVLDHALWQGRYGADPAVLGRTMTVDGVTREIVGVLPAGFRFPGTDARLFLPFRFDPAHVAAGDYNYDAIARLKEGVGPADAEGDMNRVIAMLPEAYGVSRRFIEEAGLSARVTPLKEAVIGDIGGILWTLMATVAFVFFIACANVANLCLVRAEGRRREVAVRVALGAGRGHLIRQFLLESSLLGLLAGAAGVALAYAGLQWLLTLGPTNIPRLDEIGLHGSALAFAVGISLFAVVLLGFFPLSRSRSPHLVGALKEGGRTRGKGGRPYRVQDLLAVTQVALALVLLVGALLMIRTFRELRSVDPGFDDPSSVLTVRVSLSGEEYVQDDYRRVSRFHERVLNRIRELPGVVSAGGINVLPMAGEPSGMGTWFEDFPLAPDEPSEVLRSLWVTDGYFETMGIELVAGRTIDRFDHRDRTGAVVINRGLARRRWGEEDPLGSRLRPFSWGEWYTVVGVVEDVHQYGTDQDPPDMVYYPMVGVGYDTTRFAWLSRSMGYAVRTEADPLDLVPAVRRAVWDADPDLPVAQIQTMDAVRSRSMVRTSFSSMLLGIAAVMALLLGGIGVYGVVSYGVTQRTREMGVRIALGARRWKVIRLVVRRGLAIAVVGAVIGVSGALALTRLMESLLFGISASDPLTLAGAAAVLTGVVALASYLPARRAASVDPVEALAVE